MRLGLIALLNISILYSTVTRSPSADGGTTCLGRPCTYTITCTPSASNSEIQSAVDDAWRGDTVAFTAGCTWTSSSGPAVWLNYRPNGTGRVILTTTQSAKLPNSDTRITPVYLPLVPKFELTGGTGPFFGVGAGYEGGSGRTAGSPGDHYEIVGLSFYSGLADPTSSTDYTSGFIKIGSPPPIAWSKAAGNFTAITVSGNIATLTFSPNAPSTVVVGDKIKIGHPNPAVNGARTILSKGATTVTVAMTIADGTYTDNAQYMHYMADDTQVPDDTVIDRTIFYQNGLTKIRRLIYANGKNTVIKNSWLTGARSNGFDSQLIVGLAGTGPITIENNYMGSPVSENIMFGGDSTPHDNPTTGIYVRYNYFSHNPLEGRTRTWALMKSDADPLIFKGRVVRPTVSNNWYYIAMNSGQLGTSEPTWCTTASCEVVDGTVTWRRWTGSTQCAWCIKNLFEIKSARDAYLSFNVFDRKWFQDQIRAINIKNEQQSLYPSFSNNCVPTFSGTVTTNGTTVTKVSGTLPWQNDPTGQDGVNSKAITINGVGYTISTFDTENQLTLTTDAGIQAAPVAFTYGNDPAVRLCQAGQSFNFNMTHNVLRNMDAVLVSFPGTNAHKALSGGYYFKHNKIENEDYVEWASLNNGAYSGSTATLLHSPVVPQFVMDHNTFIADNSHWAIYGDGSDADTAFTGDTVIKNNIFNKRISGALRSTYATAAPQLCGTATCPPNQFDKNMFAGANISSYNTGGGVAYNACAGATGCGSPDYTTIFKNYNKGDYKVAGTSGYRNLGTDGADLGANFDMLPEIRDLRVTTTDRMVEFQYSVTQPISHIPCVVELSVSPDFTSYAAELNDISTYYKQDSDYYDRFIRNGRKRQLILGHTVNLSPETKYYYRLHCGGDMRDGNFTTLAALAGTTTITQKKSGLTSLAWGYNYSRATNTPSSGGSASCSSGTCTITGVTKGRLIYLKDNKGRVVSLIPR